MPAFPCCHEVTVTKFFLWCKAKCCLILCCIVIVVMHRVYVVHCLCWCALWCWWLTQVLVHCSCNVCCWQACLLSCIVIVDMHFHAVLLIFHLPAHAFPPHPIITYIQSFMYSSMHLFIHPPSFRGVNNRLWLDLFILLCRSWQCHSYSFICASIRGFSEPIIMESSRNDVAKQHLTERAERFSQIETKVCSHYEYWSH